jgi:integrase
MSIRKDPRSPYWQYDFQRNKQRFHGSTGCTSKRDAERFEAELKRKVALGDTSKPAATLDVAAGEFWDAQGQHDKAAKTTEYQTANLCDVLGKHHLIGAIGMKEFRAFIATRRAQGVSAASINRELEVARRIWKLALSNGYDVPTPGTPGAIVWRDLMLPEPKERVRSLTADEEARLFAALDDDLAAVVRFALLSGQRKGAVIGLRWDRVDLQGMRAEVHTKGDKWHSFPLTETMADVIRSRPVVAGCPFVFTYECQRHAPARQDRPRRVKGQRYPFSKQGWDRHWRAALKEAGVQDFRFHDLRHTSATRIMRATGNIKAASKLLGHTDIGTTSRYAHVVEDDLRAVMAASESRNNHG